MNTWNNINKAGEEESLTFRRSEYSEKIRREFVARPGLGTEVRMGIATHFGLIIDSPTIGVAENKLYGKYAEPALNLGSYSLLRDDKTEEEIGVVLRTKTNVKPIFVSPGNKIILKESREIALASTRGYKLPEPTRLAHNLTNAFRRGEIS